MLWKYNRDKVDPIEGPKFHFPVDIDGSRKLDTIFSCVRDALKATGALILPFKPIKESSEDNGILKFEGDWNMKEKTPADIFHTMLVVGVQLTDSFGDGLSFLVQDSSLKKPFVIVGLDLVRSMNFDALTALQQGLQFSAEKYQLDTSGDEHKFSSASATFCGGLSPPSISAPENLARRFEQHSDERNKSTSLAGKDMSAVPGLGPSSGIWLDFDPSKGNFVIFC
jgi:hypothetical protein